MKYRKDNYMKEKYTIYIPDEDTAFIQQIERAHYECQGRQNVINFMHLNGINNYSNYEEYWDEYLIYLKIYTELKNELYEKYLLPQINNKNITSQDKWTLNFETKRISVYDE